MRRTTWIKLAIGLVAVGVLGYLFVRSARSVQSTPYTTSSAGMTGWTLAVESPATPSGAVLVLRPPQGFANELFGQIFSRMSESLRGPNPASMPLLLRDELDRALDGSLTSEQVLTLAQSAGLESATLVPRCLASRRISEPGVTRQLYFVLFDFPAFHQFRQQLLQQARTAGAAVTFDPDALSPVVIAAATDAAFDGWLPIRSDGSADCLAPITVQ